MSKKEEFDTGYDALIEAFKILRKYTNSTWNIDCKYDEMNAFVEEEPTEEEIERLEECGFNQKSEDPTWFYSYWHGSC